LTRPIGQRRLDVRLHVLQDAVGLRQDHVHVLERLVRAVQHFLDLLGEALRHLSDLVEDGDLALRVDCVAGGEEAGRACGGVRKHEADQHRWGE
jgi:hypothetical protein